MSCMKLPPFSSHVGMTLTSATGTYGPAPGEPTLLESGAVQGSSGLSLCSAWGLACSLVSSFRQKGPWFQSRCWVVEPQLLSVLCCHCRKCVREWEEPHDSALYCIRTDGNHMIASGSSHYGVVRLWDKRQTQCLQVRAGWRPGSSGASGSFSGSQLPVSL